jgi:succinoglycan biosynthesis protein ExoA
MTVTEVDELRSRASVKSISIVVPMWNEAAHVENLVGDIAAQDFDGTVEVFVADGNSTDGSRALLEEASGRAGLRVTVLENPARWVSPGLNACIERATGDLIVRLDAHSRYPPDYLRRSAVAVEETGALVVGGVFIGIGRTPMERAVACAMDSPFGGIHWTRHGIEGPRVEVDTVPYGAFKPEAFRRAGLFDETLVRNQDDEFNLRLRRQGGRVVLDPSVRIFYTPRGSFRQVFRQYYEYGLWKVRVMLKHSSVVSGRSLVPLLFVGSLVVLAAASVWVPLARTLLAAEIAAWLGAAVGFAVLGIRRKREQWRLLPRVIASFAGFHLGYGVGMAAGWLRTLGSTLRAVRESS